MTERGLLLPRDKTFLSLGIHDDRVSVGVKLRVEPIKSWTPAGSRTST